MNRVGIGTEITWAQLLQALQTITMNQLMPHEVCPRDVEVLRAAATYVDGLLEQRKED